MKIELPTGDTWEVLAFKMPDEETAGAEFDRIQTESLMNVSVEEGGDFSVWRTTTPDRSLWAIVLCGAPDKLAPVTVNGGEPLDMDEDQARVFALRRAKLGFDAFVEGEGDQHFTQQAHFPHGARINPETGDAVPEDPDEPRPEQDASSPPDANPDFDPSNPEFQEWSRKMFAAMKDGAVWGVPRSGLIFTKRDGGLVLTAEMPWIPFLPMKRADWWEHQTTDFNAIKEHFGAVGIRVEREQVSI